MKKGPSVADSWSELCVRACVVFFSNYDVFETHVGAPVFQHFIKKPKEIILATDLKGWPDLNSEKKKGVCIFLFGVWQLMDWTVAVINFIPSGMRIWSLLRVLIIEFSFETSTPDHFLLTNSSIYMPIGYLCVYQITRELDNLFWVLNLVCNCFCQPV